MTKNYIYLDLQKFKLKSFTVFPQAQPVLRIFKTNLSHPCNRSVIGNSNETYI